MRYYEMGFYNSIMYSWSYPSHRFCKSFFLTETTKQILGVPMLMASFWLVCFILSFPPLSSTINLNNSPTVLPRGFRTSPLGKVGIAFSQFRAGQNIIPKAFGTVFGPKAKMIPIVIGTAKYPYGLPRG